MQLRPAQPDEIDPFIALLEDAAQWMHARGIDQWRPGVMIAQRRAFIDGATRRRIARGGGSGRMIGGCAVARAPIRSGRIGRSRPRCIWASWWWRAATAATDWANACSRRRKRIARERGARWLRLDCVASNESLARYYQRLGYYPRGAVDGLLRHDKRLVAEAGVVVGSLDAVDFEHWRPARVATLLFVVRDGTDTADPQIARPRRRQNQRPGRHGRSAAKARCSARCVKSKRKWACARSIRFR